MYEKVLGLEIHLQVKTNSKMFCGCNANYFKQSPNTHTCPVCLGLPGSLPVPNLKAIEQCIKLSLALNCTIAQESKFDRKNYFYPDLPKGYQISQYDQPIGQNGYLEFEVLNKKRKINITRVHIEEDTAKSLHVGEETLIDFNKSGIPLIEIVTEPEFKTGEEIDAFAKRLRQIVRYCNISNADMEKGQMRYELNMSIRKIGEKKLPNYKIEVKNIGSISVLQKVIEFEYNRQKELLESSTKISSETRGLIGMTGETRSQRVKEGAKDYRYFPEPDIPPMYFQNEMIERIKSEIPELPEQKLKRYNEKYNLERELAETIIMSKQSYKYFEETIDYLENLEYVITAAKFQVGVLRNLIKTQKSSFAKISLKPKEFADFVNQVAKERINANMAREILETMILEEKNFKEVVNTKSISRLTDAELEALIQKVIVENQDIVSSIEKNPNAIKALIGIVMRHTKATADANKVQTLIKKILST